MYIPDLPTSRFLVESKVCNPEKHDIFIKDMHRRKTLLQYPSACFRLLSARKTSAKPLPMHRCLRLLATLCLIATCPLATGSNADAQGWSVTEVQYQGGSALQDHDVSPTGTQHLITFQHASGWNLGENFFFVDMACCSGAGDANREIYMEWYPFLSLGAITGKEIAWGPVRGVGPLGGINWGAQGKLLKIAPGFRLQLDLPGFAFANLDYLYLVDRSAGLAEGGAPQSDNSHLIDFNWALPFDIGGGAFSLEGHAEWQSKRNTEVGHAPYWILMQPQLRLDVGKALAGNPGRFFAGTELHIWINKFGFEDADEVIPQFLAVFRF